MRTWLDIAQPAESHPIEESLDWHRRNSDKPSASRNHEDVKYAGLWVQYFRTDISGFRCPNSSDTFPPGTSGAMITLPPPSGTIPIDNASNGGHGGMVYAA